MPRGRPRKIKENNNMEENKDLDYNLNIEYNELDQKIDEEEELEFSDDKENPSNQLLDLQAITEDNKETKPLQTSPLWHDYVMSQFTDEELLKEKNSSGELTGKKYPSIYGLRRVAELLIGEITQNSSEFIEINNGFAIAECQIVFNNEFGISKVFNDVGNCSTSTKPPYDAHLPSIAATRAEGRTLRKALKLRTVSAEEMTGGLTDVNNNDNNDLSSNLTNELSGAAQPVQITALKKVAERAELDIDKFAVFFRPDKNIDNWTGEDAQVALSFLHSYNAGKVKVPNDVKLSNIKVNELVNESVNF